MAKRDEADHAEARLARKNLAPVHSEQIGFAFPIGADIKNSQSGERKRDMRAIELQRPSSEAEQRLPPIADEEARAIGESDRDAREKDEGFGGLREAKITRGEVLQRVARHMIDKDHAQDASAPEIDPL